jgi:hypothetical protein
LKVFVLIKIGNYLPHSAQNSFHTGHTGVMPAYKHALRNVNVFNVETNMNPLCGKQLRKSYVCWSIKGTINTRNTQSKVKVRRFSKFASIPKYEKKDTPLGHMYTPSGDFGGWSRLVVPASGCISGGWNTAAILG